MIQYVVRRFLLVIPVMVGVVTIVFLTVHMIPGDPVDYMLGESAQAADKADLREALGLNRPLVVQYLAYWKNVLCGDLGRSIASNEPVVSLIGNRLPTTVALAIAALCVALGLAFPLGMLSGAKPGSFFDHGAMLGAVLGLSIPNFWLGPLLILFFSIHMDLFPVAGLDTPTAIVLPAVTLGTALAALSSRMIRTQLIEVMHEDYIRVARAKGVSEMTVFAKHALRNALLPVVTVVGIQFGTLLAGAVITEKVFNLNGVGTLLLESVVQRNYPVLQGTILVLAASYVSINLLTDLLYAVVDPRIRLS